MKSRTDDRRLSWTHLGTHMGYTATQAQREAILAAIERMTWTTPPVRPDDVGAAVCSVVRALTRHRFDQLRLLGVAQFTSGAHLVGLEDSLGGRRYLIDLGAEAIYVLAEYSPALAYLRQRAA
jgi:hypothetical protein